MGKPLCLLGGSVVAFGGTLLPSFLLDGVLCFVLPIKRLCKLSKLTGAWLKWLILLLVEGHRIN